MQNQIQRIDTQELRERLESTDKDIGKLEKALEQPFEDFDLEQQAHDKLGRMRIFRGRVEAQLNKNLQAEAAEAKQLAESKALERMAALRDQHLDGCSQMQQDINAAASALEKLVGDLTARRGELLALGNEHAALYRQVHGEYPDVPQRLNLNSTFIPGDCRKLEDFSVLFPSICAMFSQLTLGVSYTLIDDLTAKVIEAARFKPGLPTGAKPVDESNLSIGQKMALRRPRHLFD